MLSAGVGLTAALRTSVAHGSGAIHHAAMAAAKSIESGSSLTAALKKHPRVFPHFDVTVIEAAEMSGRLPDAFHALAGWYGLKARIWCPKCPTGFAGFKRVFRCGASGF
ncbi:MAG: type II secretion system F family protein [Deltaproteobacteria bacterium]|jgi:type II secretory pathway component PulF|nr:type II secretion system F family protein [Deltaproteobacteria bacterium]